ncbi:MAG: class I SAM-dependent methyltransferase [Eubacteriales bacterium]
MELSKRLQAVVDLVTIGSAVADIGCDHGYVSIYLYTHEISSKIIALDVNKGPLMKANEHIEKYGCKGIETRLSNGLDKLEVGEVDTMICAGMGGRLILQMIEHNRKKVVQIKECILQPQSEIGIVRHQLITWGFEFLEETMVYEDGKYYPIMKVVQTNRDNDWNYRECEFQFGPILLANHNAVLFHYLRKRKQQYEALYQEISQQENKGTTVKRIEELQKELELIQEAIGYYPTKE